MFRTNRIPNGAGLHIARQGKEFPLNIVILIVDHIHDTPTLAAVTRTSKLLYYMTLPRLYENVRLQAYPTIRTFDGLPEGYGSGSPFSMALTGLITHPFATYVKNWSLCGEWREEGVEEFRAGRVPDSVVMLNAVVRAAMDRMDNLKTFRWQLSTKPMLPVYAGLALRTTLTSLAIQFPSSRTPRPTAVIPPIPNLISFSAFDIDPLCYPDDISLLLLGSKKIQNITLSWSPRMRREGESSVHLSAYFGRCVTAGHVIDIRRLSLKNLYAPNDLNMEKAFNVDGLESMDMINCMNLWDPATAFIDETWRFKGSRRMPKRLKSIRSDSLDKGYVEFMSSMQGLEEIYMLNPTKPKLRDSRAGSDSSTPSTTVNGNTSGALDSPRQTPPERISVSLASDYIAAMTANHGSTLRILLLSEHFALSRSVLSHLLHSCPNLEQLGAALDEAGFEPLRNTFAAVPRLRAMRLLINAETEFYATLKSMPRESHALPISYEMWHEAYRGLRWIGVADLVFKLGANIPMGDGRVRRGIEMVGWEDVRHLGIWAKDNLDIE